MMNSLFDKAKVAVWLWMSSVIVAMFTSASPAQAHEVLPSIADMTQEGNMLNIDIRMNLESFIAGIDQTETADTDNAPEAATYDALRELTPAELEAEFRAYWPTMMDQIAITIDGQKAPLTLNSVVVSETTNLDSPRSSQVAFSAALPAGAAAAQIGWASEFGVLVVRQMGVEDGYDGYLAAGAVSDEFRLSGGDQATAITTFLNYIPVGFDHIVPKGLDHILFVLGLFLLSTKMGPLLWQISAFTLAHTITLALAALGYVTIPGSIVEPLIALSIVYVAVENIFTDGLSRWRPFIIFGFGLLHGLGFASVLAEFGLPEGSFIPALIGFNIGVEVGQLAVVAVAFLCVFKAIEHDKSGEASKPLAAVYLIAMLIVVGLLVPLSGLENYADLVPLVAIVAILLGLSAASVSVGRYDSYREIVAMPGSVLIAIVAAFWCVERVFL